MILFIFKRLHVNWKNLVWILFPDPQCFIIVSKPQLIFNNHLVKYLSFLTLKYYLCLFCVNIISWFSPLSNFLFRNLRKWYVSYQLIKLTLYFYRGSNSNWKLERFLMMLFVMLLSMLMILLSVLSVIRHLT